MVRKSFLLLGMLTLILPLMFLGCGNDGSQGPQGPEGPAGPPGPPGASAQLESCSICHGGNPERDGAGHQAIYDMYTDASNFAVTIDNVSSVVDNAAAGTYNVTMTFTILQNGVALADNAALQALKQKTFYTSLYDNNTMQFFDSKSFSASTATPTGTPGQFTVTSNGVAFAPEDNNAFVYMYVASDLLPTESEGRGHYHLYNNVLNIGQTFGTVDYVSAANVAGCEKCHGKPYRKHGYRMAVVTGLPDFVGCKACHYDDREGEDFDWQILADNPKRYAEIFLGTNPITPAEETQYAYTANVMNDTHMSHAMEFPYPQSMSNCATCHEGKLDMILTDANFTVETCKSCHPVNGGKDDPLLDPATGQPKLDRQGNMIYSIDTVDNPKQAPPLTKILPASVGAHSPPFATACNLCHSVSGGGILFSTIHNGYDKKIYAVNAGVATKYASAITVSIDNVSFNSATNVLTFGFSSAGTAGGLSASDISPYVMVGLYGYGTKDFLVGPHENSHQLEYTVDDPDNSRFTTVSAAPGSWVVSADLSDWAAYIGDNVTRVEVAVLPSLEDANGDLVGLNAPSTTFNLLTNAVEPTFFGNSIVGVPEQDGADGNVDGCNVCHDQLATTFHTPDRGGNIVVCRMCHTTRSGGSHLEGQSRSIDSYVHAIHAFEVFDGENYDFAADPVDETIYKLHIEHTYPRFTLLDCESCHIGNVVNDYPAIRFNVPDQSKSLPGVLSGDSGPLNFDRNIGDIPSYITGPAARACGACHRVFAINAEEGMGDAGELATLFGHWGSFGTLAETPPADLDTVINDIFSAL